MERKEGYYWVMWKDKWEIAYYIPDEKKWKFYNCSRVTDNDKAFKQIDPTPITRNENEK